MSGSPITLLGHMHTCPKTEPGPVPHVGGPVARTQTLVSADGIPVAVVGDQCACVAGGPDTIAAGSTLVTIQGKPIARIGDHTEHDGVIVEGSSYITAE